MKTVYSVHAQAHDEDQFICSFDNEADAKECKEYLYSIHTSKFDEYYVEEESHYSSFQDYLTDVRSK